MSAGMRGGSQIFFELNSVHNSVEIFDGQADVHVPFLGSNVLRSLS